MTTIQTHKWGLEGRLQGVFAALRGATAATTTTGGVSGAASTATATRAVGGKKNATQVQAIHAIRSSCM